MLVGKTDVPPGMTLWQAARKAVVMNVSDLAAKGVVPSIILCSLGLPRELTEADVVQIAKGLDAGAREYEAHVTGGDVNECDDITICCTVFGTCKKRKPVSRGGARPRDIVAVTGLFGRTAAGLKLILEKLDSPSALRKELLRSVYEPRARLREGIALAQGGVLSSSIDSSDGLAWSLHELSLASRVGFVLTHVPIADETRAFASTHGLDPVELALYGGEEYELVVTVKPSLWKRALKVVSEAGSSLYEIGYVTEKRRIVLRMNGKEMPIEAKGWEHFVSGVG